MPKFLIIDGSSMLSTSYYGNLPKSILFAKTDEEKERHYPEILHTSDGKYTNAMFTMLRTLLAVYKKVKPEYVAFTFDMTRDTFRRTQLGADFYKANRKETAQPLKEQFVQMEELLKAIGCPVFMSQDYEADDYAASLVEKFQGPDLQTYVPGVDLQRAGAGERSCGIELRITAVVPSAAEVLLKVEHRSGGGDAQRQRGCRDKLSFHADSPCSTAG